jgi:cell division protein FtsB
LPSGSPIAGAPATARPASRNFIAHPPAFKGTIAGKRISLLRPRGKFRPADPGVHEIATGRRGALSTRAGELRSIRYANLLRGGIMSDLQAQPVAAAPPLEPGLTQMQRAINIFTAPSKTFTDIRDHSRSWWLPLIVAALGAYILYGAITAKIGWSQVVDNAIHLNPKAEDRLAQLTPEQRDMQKKVSLYFTQGVFIGSPALVLAVTALGSLGLWGTINFLFGGKAKYGSIFAVWMYATLPGIIKALLGTAVIFTGVAPESFNINNFSPTNPAAFLDPIETNKALYALASSLDVITIWTLVLLGMGTAIVAGVKRNSGYIAVFGWWAIFVLIGVGWNAAFG